MLCKFSGMVHQRSHQEAQMGLPGKQLSYTLTYSPLQFLKHQILTLFRRFEQKLKILEFLENSCIQLFYQGHLHVAKLPAYFHCKSTYLFASG